MPKRLLIVAISQKQRIGLFVAVYLTLFLSMTGCRRDSGAGSRAAIDENKLIGSWRLEGKSLGPSVILTFETNHTWSLAWHGSYMPIVIQGAWRTERDLLIRKYEGGSNEFAVLQLPMLSSNIVTNRVAKLTGSLMLWRGTGRFAADQATLRRQSAPPEGPR